MSFVELKCSLCKFDLRQSKHSTGQKTVEVVVEADSWDMSEG